MKFQILQQDIIAPLQAVARSVGIKNSLPVLSNILFQVKGNSLSLSATNLEVGIIKKISIQGTEDGELTVPARTVIDVVASLTNETLVLEAAGDQLTIVTKNFNAVINGIPATEFPAIPLTSEKNATFDSTILKSTLPEITFAAATDEGRPVLTGILTTIKKDSIEFVATDGFRLAHKQIALKNSIENPFTVLIPKKTLEEVTRLISEENKTADTNLISLSSSENQNQILFSFGDTTLSSRLIEGNFPSWEKIVPTSFVCQSQIKRGELLKAVKIASVFARNEANIIKLIVDKEKITLTSQSRELGEQKTEIEAVSEGLDQPQFIVAFNSKYLIDVLNACSAEELTLFFSGTTAASVVKPLTEGDTLEYVIMPIRA